MKKIFFLLATLLVSISSFALSDMVSVDFPAGSRTVPIEDLKDMYYSNTKDSLFLVLEDTTYAFKADSSLHVAFLDPIEGQHKREREALIAIYKALDGDNWEYNDNWCSDKPLSEWYGVFYENNVTGLQLENNNLDGNIPLELSNLVYLNYLNLRENNIKSIPDVFANLNNLTSIKLPCIKNLPLESILRLTKLIDLNLDIRGLEISSEITFEYLTELVNLEIFASGLKMPLGINKAKFLTNVFLSGFEGEFPDLNGLNNLYDLSIVDGKMSGQIPVELARLEDLSGLKLYNNQLSGAIPPELFLMPNIESIDLSYNNLSGTIPVEMASFLTKTDYYPHGKLNLTFNNLTGPIPEEVERHPNWYKAWEEIIFHNNFNISQLYLPAPHLRGVDIDGEYIDTDELYRKNTYTILWEIPCGFAYEPLFNWDAHFMKEIYEKYSSYKVEILYHGTSYYPEEVTRLRDSLDLPWHCFFATQMADSAHRLVISDEKQNLLYYHELNSNMFRGNTVTVVDSMGRVVFMSPLDDYEESLDLFLCKNLKKDAINYYVSSDYSQNMLIDTLQLATIGNGIDIVLMGDAYSDRQIADGTYLNDLKYLYDNLFTEEPYRSCKEMFNVYTINVVSHTEGYDNGVSMLGGFFGNETEVGGNDAAVIEYARCVIPTHKLDNAIVIVAMNSDRYAGTCYMYYPESSNVDGCGLSISYFPKGGDATTFAQLLHHEALGHGFAKLGDEYAYKYLGEIPEETVIFHQQIQSDLGWFKNVDFTSDSTEVSWSKFLFDDRYQYDGLGVFEGGLTYWTGVWRPTENSIMRYNFGGFNAPSREAIYYRIHKLAYGEEWEYDYEKFVELDAKNRKKADSPLLMPSREAVRNFVPTHPPVIKQMNWREALEDKQAPKKIQSREKVTPSNDQSQGTVKYVITTKK